MISPVTIKGVFNNARTTRSLSQDEVLFREGDAGDDMYGVISGAVELRRGEKVVLRIGPDGTFGELAIIDASPRSLTAIAVEQTTTNRLGFCDVTVRNQDDVIVAHFRGTVYRTRKPLPE